MNGAIILAAGEGSRFGSKKQFTLYKGKMLYEHVLNTMEKCISRDNIVVVGVDIPGGSTRSESVFKGLKFLSNKNIDKVIIAEAARPLVTVKQIEEILNTQYKSNTFVMPLVNTVVYRTGVYINRNDLYDLLVPQSFDFNLLYKAYMTGKYKDYTDDTRIVFEEYNIKPHFILTGDNLYKVTYKKDLAVLDSILENCKE